MRVVLLGPPGAGKGSLALLCGDRLGLTHLSTGEIFRQEMARESLLGRRVRRYVTSGQLVPNALVVRVMASRLKGPRRSPRTTEAPQGRRPMVRGSRGFVLDGFPRTAGQAAGLDRVLRTRRLPLDGAVYLTSPKALLVRRLSGRRVCPSCGANYHLRTMRPKRPGRCDRCGSALVTRKDDQLATIRKRLDVDERAAKPLLAYYRRRSVLYEVDGRGHIETVFRRAVTLFRHQGWLRR